jgi:hypothetical protein
MMEMEMEVRRAMQVILTHSHRDEEVLTKWKSSSNSGMEMENCRWVEKVSATASNRTSDMYGLGLNKEPPSNREDSVKGIAVGKTKCSSNGRAAAPKGS